MTLSPNEQTFNCDCCGMLFTIDSLHKDSFSQLKLDIICKQCQEELDKEELGELLARLENDTVDYDNVEELHYHKKLGWLTKSDVNEYLDFTSTVLDKLTRFEVWEAENIFDEDDNPEWDEGAIETFLEIDKLRIELENKLYGL